MIVYQSNKRRFLVDAFTKDIEDVILTAFKARTGKAASRSEVQTPARGGICKLSLGGSWDSWRIVPNVYNATP